jgi:hypothetical protein
MAGPVTLDKFLSCLAEEDRVRAAMATTIAALQWYVAEARAELRKLNAEPGGAHIPMEAWARAAP